jgi:cystathionine beta-lyase
MAPPEATYLAWLDARESAHPNPWTHARENGVVLSDGTDFGAPGFIRLNFGCPATTLEIGLARMRKAFGAG